MRVLDLFCGLKGWSTPFAEAGHDVTTLDIEERFEPTIAADVLAANFEPGQFDIVLASPPCEKFSILAIGRAWLPGYVPRHDGTRLAMDIVLKTVDIIETVRPSFWVIENPVGMLRKLNLIPYERGTVTYCQYGAPWRKPTDLWGGFPPSLELRRRCRNGDACHIASPRGSTTGVQGGGSRLDASSWGWDARTGSASQERKDQAAIRAQIPAALANDVRNAAERDLALGRRAADYSGRLFA
jgi:hypothetical protein